MKDRILAACEPGRARSGAATVAVLAAIQMLRQGEARALCARRRLARPVA